MIPSDHFVRFYNEVFKYLSARGEKELLKYYGRISENQEFHCLELFTRQGLKGMYEYWERIRIEENCDMTHQVDEECYSFEFHSCPSLSKAVDNDAGASPAYCNHCPGWILPLMSKAGFYAVYNLIDCREPRCAMKVFARKEPATENAAELVSKYGTDVILTNF